MSEKLLVTVSGGRSSAYMAIKLHREYQDKFDMHFVYANTGQEHPKTIEFLKNIRDHFGIHIHLIEAVVDPDLGKGTRFKEVTWDTLSMNGKPFEDVIAKYGLPNSGYLHCTRELKISPMDAYMRKHGIKKRTLGIRYDEESRHNPMKHIIYPLYDWRVTKQRVNRWWSEQEFDLEIPDYLGNCLTCYKKSDKKLNLIAVENPEYFNFFKAMEEKYPDDKRQIFRGYRTTQDVLDGKIYDRFNDDVCAEECGTVII